MVKSLNTADSPQVFLENAKGSTPLIRIFHSAGAFNLIHQVYFLF